MKRYAHPIATALLAVLVLALAIKVFMLQAELAAWGARVSSLDAEIDQLRSAR
jgi:hypothetical protein